METYSKFEKTFSKLGTSQDVPSQMFGELAEFVCYLYGHKIKDIDKASWN